VDAIGLWAIAERTPDRAAVIEPDGRVVSYAGLAAEADRYGRGLRALGLTVGDAVAGLLPNSATALAVYFAAIETGLYVVPVNWHQVTAEVGYILGDSTAGAFVVHERFAAMAAGAADLAGIKHRFAVGAVPGFEPLSGLGDDGSAGRPHPRTHGAPMLYTSGTSGRPKGVRRPLTGMDPDDAAVMATWFFSLFGLAPYDDHVHLCGSPLYHTAVLNFAAISIQLGHPVVLMDGWDPQEALRLIERYEPPAPCYLEVPPRAAVGHGATEAPRGVLFHRYAIDAAGLITSARIVPPTSQNQASIEDDLRRFVAGRLDLDDERLTRQCEQAIRNYDPCISCSTHFLDLTIDRG